MHTHIHLIINDTCYDTHTHIYYIHIHVGDFHFLWECLKVIYMIYWGNPSQPGSLCNLREQINRKQVDKSAKVFNVGDEFLLHCFKVGSKSTTMCFILGPGIFYRYVKAHLTARICTLLKINNAAESIPHESSQVWLRDTALQLWSDTLAPTATDDPVFAFHRSFLHMAFLYVDLRNAIRWENGPHIITHWKLWLPRFIATGCKNYATESVHLLTNVYADLPRHLAYIAIHNRTVNLEGKPGRGKPVDQMTEHYILYVM